MSISNPFHCRRGAVDLMTVLLIVGLIGIGVFVYLARNGSSAARPSSGTGAIQWGGDFDAAARDAKTKNRPILIDFSASWCPPCKMMKEDVWPDATIAQLASSKYIPLFVDVDEQQALASKYSVDAIPTVLILDKDGQTLFRKTGYISVPDLTRALNEHSQ